MYALSAILLFFGRYETKALPMRSPEDQAQAACSILYGVSHDDLLVHLGSYPPPSRADPHRPETSIVDAVDVG